MAASPHELVDALYVGLQAANVEMLRPLFIPTATLVRAVDPITIHTVESWLAGLHDAFAEIEELEDQRYLIERHGSVAVAMSQFSVRHRVTKAMQRSGTNAFSMVRDGLQWRIASVTWALD